MPRQSRIDNNNSWNPCKRKDFVRKLKKIGFNPPEPGGGLLCRADPLWVLLLVGCASGPIGRLQIIEDQNQAADVFVECERRFNA